MLQYNFDRVFNVRGIERPFTFLRKAGFSEQFASRIKNNRVRRLNMAELERICLLLRCTPNDLMEWIPENNSEVSDKHPINKLVRKDHVTNLVRSLHEVPFERMEKIEKLIREQLDTE
jgi:DNA-binding Xre family transcriptional regulator